MTALTIWTLYDHPKDYPGHWVARRFENENPTSEFILSKDLEELRQHFEEMGLGCIPRSPKDDPVIVECWL